MQRSAESTYEVLEQFLTRLHFLGEAEAIDTLVDTDLSFSQVRMICVLAIHDSAIAINELAQHLRMSVAATGRAVEQLAGLGLVERREDPHDRRIRRVSLSPTGRTLMEKHFDAWRGSLRAFVQRLPVEDRERLHQSLVPILAGSTLHAATCELVKPASELPPPAKETLS
ncbi:MAG: MarR family winged helix-turn-helix transcriptional regulator [Jatrophihabitantaceae bacterium]